ncbi:MAG: Sec-independent protein translocase protein TatB [bacterium]|nr:Sec-independent protein translocase protein TatB [bacterium]
MFDLGWFEIAVVGAVLLVVVGPKDLPKVLRTVGVWTGKARRMARDFQKALDQYAKEAEIDDVKKAVETPLKAKKAVAAAVDPTGALKKELEETGREMQENMKVRDEPEATAQAAPTEPARASSGDT